MQPQGSARKEVEIAVALERKEVLSLLREVQGLDEPDEDGWDPDRLMWLA